MTHHGTGRTGRPARFSTAAVHVVFQTRPGPGGDKVIKDGGDATLTLKSGSSQSVTPKDGVYHFDVPAGDEAVFDLFGTEFKVQVLDSNGVDAYSGRCITHWNDPLFPCKDLKAVQQRLQLLGYYTGRVDGHMGQKSERAILEFQADEGALGIDGVAGPKTRKALDAFFQKHGKDSTGQHNLIRRYLIRFERARAGDASASCPHPDYRGGEFTEAAYGCKVASVANRDRVVGEPFNLGLDSEELSIGNGAEVIAKFAKNPDLAFVSLKTPDAAYIAQNRYRKPYLQVTPKVKDGEDVLNLHFGSDKGPVVGAVRIKIREMKQVKTTLHLVTIENAAGVSVPPWTQKEAVDLLEAVNAVWMPMGVEFQALEVQSHVFKGLTAGTITDDYSGTMGGRIESDDLWATHNHKQDQRINIYFAEFINWVLQDGPRVDINSGILGFAISRTSQGPNKPIGACVRKDANNFNLALTVAHELGHVLNLTCHAHAHSDDDGTDTPFRHDIWSRSRLMAKYSQYGLSNPPRTWQDSMYGKVGHDLQCGAWLTVKDLPHDDTDGELDISRNAARNPY